MSLKIRSLSPELQKIASDQLFEEPKKIGEYVEIIREWIKKSPHLRARTDDQFIVTFLRCCKYSLEKTKYKIDMFYTLRTHMPEWVQDRDPLKLRLKEILNIGGMLPLPKAPGVDSPRLILGVGGGFDPNEYTVEEFFKVWFLVMDLMMEEDDQMIVAGQMNIMDLKKATLAHFTIFTPAMLKKMTMMMQEGSPFRVKGMHYVNAPGFFETVFTFFKTFLNEKMKSRIYVHGGDVSSLHNLIPKEVLPAEYGGEAGTIEEIATYWEEKIIANREFLMDLATNFGVDEKKRIGVPKSPENLFGVEGSFRKLDFD